MSIHEDVINEAAKFLAKKPSKPQLEISYHELLRAAQYYKSIAEEAQPIMNALNTIIQGAIDANRDSV